MSERRATIRGDMAPFERKHSPEQREAMAVAVVDHGMTAPRVVSLAASGDLKLDGRALPAFEANPSTVRGIAHRERERRSARVVTEAAKMPPRDSIEAMRRQLHEVAHRKVARMRRRDPDDVKPEELREMARALEVLFKLPIPNVVPDPEQRPQSETSRMGTAARVGSLIQAHRNGEKAIPRTGASTTEAKTENGHAGAASEVTLRSTEAQEAERPGSREGASHAHIAGLG